MTQLKMKKRKGVALIVMLFVFCISAFAQMEVVKPDRFLPKFGVKAGLNIANFMAEDNDGILSDVYDPRIGFHAGVLVEFPLGKRFAVEPNILVSRKGYEYGDTWIDSIDQEHEYYEEYNLYYLDIPIYFKVMAEFGIVKIYGAAGPYFGIGIGGKIYDYQTIDNGPKDENETKVSWGNTEDKDNLKQLDYGLTLGAGLEIKGILVSFAYDLGLSNISVYTDNGFKINNRVIRISLGYKIGLIK